MEAFPHTIQTACKVALPSALLPYSSQDSEGQEQHQNGASHRQYNVDASTAGKAMLGVGFSLERGLLAAGSNGPKEELLGISLSVTAEGQAHTSQNITGLKIKFTRHPMSSE